jgi:hypothetical protein
MAKRTRSWSEIDKSRGKRRSDVERDRGQEKLVHTQAYQDYKKNLEKMFGGEGEVPEAVKDQLDPTGEKGKRDAALKNLRKLEAEDRKAWSEAVFQFVQEFELPDDPYFADSLLDHSKGRVVDKALTKLEELVEAGKVVGAKRPKSLEHRLKGIELTSLDDEQRARAKALRAKLG